MATVGDLIDFEGFMFPGSRDSNQRGPPSRSNALPDINYGLHDTHAINESESTLS